MKAVTMPNPSVNWVPILSFLNAFIVFFLETVKRFHQTRPAGRRRETGPQGGDENMSAFVAAARVGRGRKGRLECQVATRSSKLYENSFVEIHLGDENAIFPAAITTLFITALSD
jgi:hypothetical protein